jgi:hypothetical protein
MALLRHTNFLIARRHPRRTSSFFLPAPDPPIYTYIQHLGAIDFCLFPFSSFIIPMLTTLLMYVASDKSIPLLGNLPPHPWFLLPFAHTTYNRVHSTYSHNLSGISSLSLNHWQDIYFILTLDKWIFKHAWTFFFVHHCLVFSFFLFCFFFLFFF